MLELKHVSLQLPGDQGPVEILKDVSLTFEPGKIYVITGPNGGGKSSLAKAIMGIYRPTEGQIALDGTDLTDLGIPERARKGMGYAFQQPARFKGIRVRDFLQLAAGQGRSVDACGLLFDVGLCAQDYIDREIDASFSGGELKRVEIASILARELKVAIFDEPEAGIDLWSFQKLTETFEAMNRQSETTIIIISHQERILQLADQVVVMSKGRVSEITDREKILNEIKTLDAACRCRATCSRGGRADAQCHR